jgi:hypothetical protein
MELLSNRPARQCSPKETNAQKIQGSAELCAGNPQDCVGNDGEQVQSGWQHLEGTSWRKRHLSWLVNNEKEEALQKVMRTAFLEAGTASMRAQRRDSSLVQGSEMKIVVVGVYWVKGQWDGARTSQVM